MSDYAAQLMANGKQQLKEHDALRALVREAIPFMAAVGGLSVRFTAYDRERISTWIDRAQEAIK